ncbi:unnamed protein product [Cuscuta epithymum]|uniref:Secreted protein n=1 Tax=Cuscuta epithymum TaxID=186058 RepID=A0AAV0CNF9_9ASTE|nr:unnamed protein product [Cuscuta epithymum]
MFIVTLVFGFLSGRLSLNLRVVWGSPSPDATPRLLGDDKGPYFGQKPPTTSGQFTVHRRTEFLILRHANLFLKVIWDSLGPEKSQGILNLPSRGPVFFYLRTAAMAKRNQGYGFQV